MSALAEALRARVLWLTVQRSAVEGRACRDYLLRDDAGHALVTARAFNWGREIMVCEADRPRHAVLLLRRRRSFPITGKVDVLQLPSQRRLGVASRSGNFRDAAGRALGRFQDARSLGNRAKEGVFLAVAEALMGGDGTDSQVSGPSGFVYVVDGAPAGTLSRARLPFPTESVAQPTPGKRRLRDVLPARLQRAFQDARAPRGWKFERTTSGGSEDPRLVLAAALFAVELSHW